MRASLISALLLAKLEACHESSGQQKWMSALRLLHVLKAVSDNQSLAPITANLKKKGSVIIWSLANILAGNRWIGECSEDEYNLWTGRIQALDYNFKGDVTTLAEAADSAGLTFDQCFVPPELNDQPLVYSLHAEGNLSIETLAVFENLLGFTTRLNKELIDPLEVSRGTSFLVSKYAPFLVHAADLKKYTENVLSVFTK